MNIVWALVDSHCVQFHAQHQVCVFTSNCAIFYTCCRTVSWSWQHSKVRSMYLISIFIKAILLGNTHICWSEVDLGSKRPGIASEYPKSSFEQELGLLYYQHYSILYQNMLFFPSFSLNFNGYTKDILCIYLIYNVPHVRFTVFHSLHVP